MDENIKPIVDRLKELEEQLQGLYSNLIVAIQNKNIEKFKQLSGLISPLRDEYSDLASRMRG